jgi:CRISPR system Cascade subunit CasD
MNLSSICLIEDLKMHKHLAIYLDGPMQSWGYMSKFDRRTSLAYPTKSGVIGILCAALGIQKSDTTKLAEIAGLKMTAYVLSSLNRITDFHTVGGGFDKKMHSQNIVKKASGSSGDTVVTHREYLLDAKFAVILSGKLNLLQQLESALKNPLWGIWLGRKSCVPTVPISHGCHDTTENALESAKSAYFETYNKRCEVRRTVSEVAEFADGSDSFMDIPVNFAERKFSIRRVSIE